MSAGSGAAVGCGARRQAQARRAGRAPAASALALALVFAPLLGAAPGMRAGSMLPRGEVVVTLREGGVVRVPVEIAATPAARRAGLMHRRHLAPERGMLFDFGRARRLAMWMKNTYLPLDMIFADADGRIIHIARDTEPLSERTIDSRGRARWVLEVNAGFAARHGLAAGDRLDLEVRPGDSAAGG